MRTSLTFTIAALSLTLLAGCPPRSEQVAEAPSPKAAADEHAAPEHAAPAPDPPASTAEGDDSTLGAALTDAELVDVAALI